ncbi:diaminopimelate epimerase [Ornithobacterium rhinotracheale]|uniref:diaminopimelate epimerase n=1 Tax=Ornithobacterium rhinotracheale TaxID=28251 RepID=UPI00403654EE
MKIHFYKYQGAGNDFVMIDDREATFNYDQKTIESLCTRRMGVGADGLITLFEKDNMYQMRYFNSDGNESTMCGNGGRCFAQFMKDLGLVNGDLVEFNAIDGKHSAEFIGENIRLQMIDVEAVKIQPEYTFLNTGSPHHVEFVNKADEIDVKNAGAKIRYSELYPEGSNVNFVEILSPEKLKVRTYERGVEDETYSCGTGVTASAIAYFANEKTDQKKIEIETLGGTLFVEFEHSGEQFVQVFLTGPAKQVFQGEIYI